MKLTLVSIGINSHMDMSLKGVEAARNADSVYVEMYTMKMDTTLSELEELVGKPITPLPRGGMEEKGTELINEAREKDVVILAGYARKKNLTLYEAAIRAEVKDAER